MNKLVIAVIAIVAVLLIGTYNGYNYYNGPKIVDGVTSGSVDGKGNPIDFTNKFSHGDTVYFSAEVNRFWIKEAKVIWYKDQVKTSNRLHVEENIVLNDAGYFTAKLTIPDNAKEGRYMVTIFVKGSPISETTAEFYVKK
ncbi:hypothetical protein H9635_14015 [Solibacillus sp. A46]|uniref:Uncharacterized protein n=1 Tax=Solibacillus faecavium TaxID=2762221 RepID=A0ABR8Y0Y7_9BACL|nr:hypothetical protein [Solibacillus faecavium]MBD8037862.1 hypothetical protein [Solibacillus faecavium]